MLTFDLIKRVSLVLCTQVSSCFYGNSPRWCSYPTHCLQVYSPAAQLLTNDQQQQKKTINPPPPPPQPRPSPLWTETMLDTVLFQCRAPAVSSPSFGCTLHSGYFITVFLPPTVEKTDGCWSPQLPFKIQGVAFLKRVQFLKAFTQQFHNTKRANPLVHHTNENH